MYALASGPGEGGSQLELSQAPAVLTFQILQVLAAVDQLYTYFPR